MSFLPKTFATPVGLTDDRFVLRHITIHDVVRDYDAVITNRDYLWSLFGDSWGWPSQDLSLEQDLIDLAWHQKEAQLRRAFNYAVVSADDTRLLGCVYVDPSEKSGYDAEVSYWLRQDGVDADLEATLDARVRAWLQDDWPFDSIGFPGRDIALADWNALPGAT